VLKVIFEWLFFEAVLRKVRKLVGGQQPVEFDCPQDMGSKMKNFRVRLSKAVLRIIDEGEMFK
jgi:hypothetical protein